MFSIRKFPTFESRFALKLLADLRSRDSLFLATEDKQRYRCYCSTDNILVLEFVTIILKESVEISFKSFKILFKFGFGLNTFN